MVDDMNSGKALKNEYEKEKFDKYKQKVIDALSSDPFGLSISQLSTVCQLSAKTLKHVLSEIDASEFAGTYTLKGHVSPDLSINRQQPKPVKQEPKVMETTEVKITFKQQMINMFKANPDGVTLEQALEILKCDRQKFDGTLCNIRQSASPVEFNIDGKRLYMPKFDVDQTLPVQTKNGPVIPVDLPVVEQEVVHSAKNEPKPVPVKAKTVPPQPESDIHETASNINEPASNIPYSEYLAEETASDPLPAAYSSDPSPSLLIDCKNMVQVQTVLKSECYLTIEQVNTLLQQLFGLDLVKWHTTGARVDGVHISKCEVV